MDRTVGRVAADPLAGLDGPRTPGKSKSQVTTFHISQSPASAGETGDASLRNGLCSSSYPSLANAMAVVGKSGAKPAAETTANYRLSLCVERLHACMHSQVFLGLELMLSMFSPI